MATTSISGKIDPVVQPITVSNVVDALAGGVRDFRRAPGYGLILGGLCSLVGLAIVGSLFAVGIPYLAYPIAAGFALVCPFVAASLYEVSRRLELGQPLSAREIWNTVKSRSEIRWLGFMTLFVFIMWMYQVRFLMALFLGDSGMSPSLDDFFNVVLTTNQGLLFLIVGNIVGAMLATILFSLSAVSFPLALDRDVDFVTAMITSVRVVTKSPTAMAFWAVVIALLLLISVPPLFLGLPVTLPVLGHATWHLYRRAVAPSASAN